MKTKRILITLSFLSFLFIGAIAQPANNNCAGAITLTSSATCSYTAGTVAAATQSVAGCAGTANDDVWYTFQAVSSSHTITVVGSGSFDAVVQVYSVSCGGTSLICRDNTGTGGTETFTLTGLTAGNYYWIRVYDYYSGTPATTTFNICVTHPTAPNCATYASPTDGQDLFCVSSTTLNWNAPTGGTAATGYYVYLGTNNPPTNIVNGAYQTGTTYSATGLAVGTTYYWQVIPTNAIGNATNCALSSFDVVPCYNMTSGTITTCGGAFYDSGGPSTSAGNSSNIVETFCPATAGQCIQATFFSFGTEASTDLLYVYNGNSTSAPQLSGSPFSGSLSPFSIVGTPTNASGCLTFQYTSNSSVQSTGWDASLICATCANTPAYPPQDCGGGVTVCSDQAFAGNSSGDGIINDLNSTNMGCLSAEHQTSWYYFSPATNGTVQLAITPANGTDDYDFAIWGPLAAVSCPPSSAPIRCSYSALDGTTGLNLTATDLSEGVGGDKWVDELTVTAGQVYILLVDNYSTSSQPFTLDWTLTNGATLNCTPLPIELVSFNGKQEKMNIQLTWITETEINNDFFTIERSVDGITFHEVGTEDGAGTNYHQTKYLFLDQNPKKGINYYRLKQTDFDGTFKFSGIVGVNYTSGEQSVSNIRPNPCSNDLYFDFLSPAGGTIKVEVFDYIGRLVLNENMAINEGQTTLNTKLGGLSKGIYSLKVSYGETGYSSVSMIIKQ